jgi:hypothetical protein
MLEFQESMSERARVLFLQALPICKDVAYRQGEANCYLMLGRLDVMEKAYSTAQENLTRALSLFEQIGDERGRDDCYETLSGLRNGGAGR